MGHVTRELDPADRRSFRVSLTADGRRAADASREAMGDLEGAALTAITAADIAGFRAVASALTELAR
jgi:DNA-binding MarR family transcriptional regulator